MRESVLDKRPETIQALLNGWFAAVDYMQGDPKDAARRMGIRQQTSGEQFLEAQRGLRVPSRAENLRCSAGDSPTAVTGGS